MEEPKDPSWLKKHVYEWPSPKGVVNRNPDDWWMTEGWSGHLHHHYSSTPGGSTAATTKTTPLPIKLPLLPDLQQKDVKKKIPQQGEEEDSMEVLLPRMMMPVMKENDRTNNNNMAVAMLDEKLDAQPDQFDFSHLPHIQDNRFIKQDAENWTPGHHLGCWNLDC